MVGFVEKMEDKNDSSYIHPNIDSDVIMTEEFSEGSLEKPKDIYDIIERFC